MERIERWFQSAAGRQNRVSTLYPGLLTNRLLPYLAYRLRFMISVQAISFAVHVAEFLILLAHAPKLAVIIVVLLRAGSPLIRGAWWGAMEVFRERLRDMKGPDAKERAQREIGNWLALSFLIAALVLVAGFSWLAWVVNQSGLESAVLVHLYIALIVIELAMRIPVLTLHSGIYANRRIYRPFFSILLPTLLQGFVIAALFSWLHEGALIVAIIIGSLCSLLINYVYIKRMYRVAGLNLHFSWEARRFFRFLSVLPAIQLFWSTLAGFLIRVDSLLVLFLVGLESLGGQAIDLTKGHPDWNTPDLGILLYLILPAIRGSYEWSVLFYFDFVRLRRAIALRDMARAFMTKLVLAAIAVGLFFWIMAGIVFIIGFRDIPLTFLLAMLPFFLLRSWLAVYQIRAFADGRFATVCVSMCLIIASVALIGTRGFADIGSFVELKICLFVALVFLTAAQFFHDRRKVAAATHLTFGDWCHTLSLEPAALNTGAMEVARGASDKEKLNIRTVLEDSLGSDGHCAWRDPHCLVYYRRADKDENTRFDPIEIVEAAAGLIARVHIVPETVDNGHEALRQLRLAKILPEEPVETVDIDRLQVNFRSLISNGFVADMSVGRRSDLRELLSRDAAASAIPAALRAPDTGALFVWRDDFRLYPVFQDQKLRAIFFVPKGASEDALQTWHRILQSWSVSQAASGLGEQG